MRKENKNHDLFNKFFSSLLVFDAFTRVPWCMCVKIFYVNVGLFLTQTLSNDFRRLFLLKLETFSTHLLQLCGKEQQMQPSENLPLCYTEEGKSNRFSMTWGGANATVCVQTGHETRSKEAICPALLFRIHPPPPTSSRVFLTPWFLMSCSEHISPLPYAELSQKLLLNLTKG